MVLVLEGVYFFVECYVFIVLVFVVGVVEELIFVLYEDSVEFWVVCIDCFDGFVC